jgi:four helix bundle protein
MKDFHDLKVWDKAHALTLEVYRATRTFPQEELYGLTSQLRRSAASVPANISEGCGRDGDAELRRFLQIAMGSASETEYHLLLARDLAYLNETSYQGLNGQTIEIKRMLASLIGKLNRTVAVKANC